MNAYIVAGYRTAVGKAKRGGFRFTRPDDLAVDVIKHLLNSVPEVDPTRVEDLIVGNAVPEAEQGMQIGRQIALRSLPQTTAGVTVNRYCGSGVETIAMASAKIHAGLADCVIAGGTESMSLVPTVGWRTALNFEVAKSAPTYYFGMGQTAEEVAKDFGITREMQDEFAYHSQMKAIKAVQGGIFQKSICPITVKEVYVEDNKRKEREFVVEYDEGIRVGTNIEGLARLRPAFSPKGTVTAGNASQTSDGAAFVMVCSERMVKELNLNPIGRMVTCTTVGVDPRIMGIGPVAAIPKALKMANKSLNDIDLIELNEAFASQSLAVMREANLDPSKVNINGGAIALGHPLGMTGTKLTIQLLDDLKRTSGKYGMVTACIGGGQGIAAVYENLN